MSGAFSREEIRRRVDALGPWFHNLDLDGVSTAPSHFLGDYPRVKWRRFAGVFPVLALTAWSPSKRPRFRHSR